MFKKLFKKLGIAGDKPKNADKPLTKTSNVSEAEESFKVLYRFVGYNLEPFSNLSSEEIEERKLTTERFFTPDRLYGLVEIQLVGRAKNYNVWGFAKWEQVLVRERVANGNVTVTDEKGKPYLVGLTDECKNEIAPTVEQQVSTPKEIKNLTKDGDIRAELSIIGSELTTFSGLRRVVGKLILLNCGLTSLGSLEEIEGDLSISSYSKDSELNSLGNLKKVAGNVDIRFSKIISLGKLEEVAGNLNLKDTSIQDFGALKRVGGNLLLPKDLKEMLDLYGFTVDGKISYWNRKNA
jgi:hypothetical protein